MEEYSKLKESLINLVKNKGVVTAQEIISWANENDVGVFTLYLLIQDLLETGEIKGEGEKFLIETNINLEIPSRLVYPKKEVRITKPPQHKQKTKQRPRRHSSQTLMPYIQQKEGTGEASQPPRKETQATNDAAKTSTSSASGPIKKDIILTREITDNPELGNLLSDQDFAKAIRYLGRYWSVGKLRFLIDMSNENIQPKKAEKIIVELARLGLVEVSENNVINAKDTLRELYKQTQSQTPLYDIFS
ncbi:MAG: hypothetical protein ACP5IE_00915 [Infirmifilum sp.]